MLKISIPIIVAAIALTQVAGLDFRSTESHRSEAGQRRRERRSRNEGDSRQIRPADVEGRDFDRRRRREFS